MIWQFSFGILAYGFGIQAVEIEGGGGIDPAAFCLHREIFVNLLLVGSITDVCNTRRTIISAYVPEAADTFSSCSLIFTIPSCIYG